MPGLEPKGRTDSNSRQRLNALGFVIVLVCALIGVTVGKIVDPKGSMGMILGGAVSCVIAIYIARAVGGTRN